MCTPDMPADYQTDTLICVPSDSTQGEGAVTEFKNLNLKYINVFTAGTVEFCFPSFC